MKNLVILLLTFFTLFGCIAEKGKTTVDIRKRKSNLSQGLKNTSISNVKIVNHQLIITGANLNDVENIKIDGNSFNELFTIETKSATRIIANSVRVFSFDISKAFNLILSDASASATFPIDFSLCQATIKGVGFNCSVTPTPNDVLSYDSATHTWKPRAINDLSYQGTWNASGGLPASGNPGDYYIVSVAGGIYSVGDWMVWNGSSFDKIDNSTTITKVFNRVGNIVATEGDYNLDQLLDVDLSIGGPLATGKILKYNGTKWVIGDDLVGGGSLGAGSVTATEIANGAVTDSKIVSVSASKITGTISSAQIADGSIVNADISATAAIDYSKLNVPDGAIPAVKISGLPAAGASLSTTITNGDTTHAPDGNSVYNALAGKISTTGGTLSVGTISGVPTPTNPSDVASKSYVDTQISGVSGGATSTTGVTEGTNLYFTEPRVRATVLTGLNTGVAGPIVAADSVLGAMGKLQYQVTDLKAFGQWTKTVNDLSYSAGDVSVEKNFKLKDSASNYVLLKAPTVVTSTYTLTLPATPGTANQVLQTNGAGGVLSWATLTDTSVQAFAKSALPTCSAGQVLKSDGTNFSCVTDATGAGSFTGAASRAMATDVGGSLIVSTTTSTELGYVNGVTSSIQTQLNAKEGTLTAGTAAQYYKGNKTWATLDTLAVPENTNLYFTAARAKTATVADSITDAITDVAPSQNAVFDALALKLSTTGGTLTVGTISGVPTPTNPSDVASKSYVDSQIAGFSTTTSGITEGSNLYFTEPRVRATVLTGLNTGVAGPITATDSVLSAMGKLQYQATTLNSNGQWIKTGNDISYAAGDVSVEKNFKLKDSGSNYVLLKAPTTVTSTYTLTMPATPGSANQVLQTNGAGGVLSWATITDASVQAFAKSALPTCSAGQVLKSDGTNFSCVTDATGAGAFTGAINRAMATDGSGALTVSTTTAAELGYVNGVTSSIQTQLNAKEATLAAGTAAQYYKGNKTWATLDTAAVPENTNLYFTAARAKTATVADSITDAITDVAPSQNAVFDALALKLATTGGTLTIGTISGIPTPVGNSEAANKKYVDDTVAAGGGGQWTTGGANIYRATGNVGIGINNPIYKLDIYDDVNAITGFRFANPNAGTAAQIQNQLANNVGALAYYGISSSNYSGFTPLNGGNAFFGSNNTNTSIFTQTAKDIIFSTNAVEAARIKSDGKINIGPDATNAYDFYRDSATGLLNFSGKQSGYTGYVFGGVDGERMRVTPAGKVGIGTAVPDTILDIRGTSGATLKIVDGNQGNGKLLTSNAAGVASWNALPTCSAGQVLKSDGTSFSCVTDATGAGAFSGAINRAVATDGSGALIVSTTTATELGYVNGVTSSIQTQLNAKQGTITAGTTAQYYRGDKTFVTLDTAVVPENGNLYFTAARAKSATVVDAIADAVLDVAPSQNAVFDALALKLNTTGGTLSVGTISGVPLPINGDEVASKAYVDSQSVASGTGVKIPGSSVVLMSTCPSGWTNNGATGGGPGQATCGGSTCQMCQSPTSAVDLPASSVVLAESCPISWTSLGAVTQIPASVGFDGVYYPSCQSPGAATSIPQNLKLVMGTTCPSAWRDIGATSAGATLATCGGSPCHICEAPGTFDQIRYLSGHTGGTTGVGGNIVIKSGAGGTTSGLSGSISLVVPAATDADGGIISIASANGATATSTARSGGAVNINSGNGVSNGSGGAITLTTGVGNGTGSAGNILLLNGNVGIGTSTPGSLLDVNGTIRANQLCDSTGANCKTISAGWGNIAAASMVANWPDAIVCDDGTNRSILIHDTRDANVEYYTKAAGGGTHSMTFVSSTGAFYSQSSFSGYTVCNNKSISTLIAEGRTFGLLGGGVDWTVSGSNIYRAGGNVGLGTSAPTTKLDVRGGIASVNPDFTSGSAGSSLSLFLGAATGNTNGSIQQYNTGGTAYGALALNPLGGNVGVGMTAPGAKLEVAGTIRSNTPESGSGFQMRNSTNGHEWHFRLNGDGVTANNLNFYNTMVGEVFSFKSNGNMSMGGTLTQASDRRFKQNIKLLESSLDKVIKLKGVSYNWIPEKKIPENQIGLIAQDVEKIYPEVVRTDSKGWKSVAYQNLVAPLIEAVKELYYKWFNDSADIHRKIASVEAKSDEKIRKLEAENTVLQNRALKAEQENAAIKARLDKIEKMLKH